MHHHIWFIIIAIWIIFDIPTWFMVSGILRQYTKYQSENYHDTILLCLCIIGGPVSFLTIMGSGGWKHWALRPETSKEIDQRLMLRKLEE